MTGLAADNYLLAIGQTNTPTLAVVKQQQAYRFADGNLIRWQSSFESDNLGFRVYREDAGRRVEITTNIIAGSALMTGRTPLTAGKSYSYWDRGGSPASAYWVEDVDLAGKTKLHGPVELTMAGPNSELAGSPDSLTLDQLRPSDNGTGVREGQITAKALRAVTRPEPGGDTWQQQLRLAGQAAVKLSVRDNGWYRVSAAQLQAAGLPENAEAKFLQLYVNGQQVPLAVRTTRGSDAGALGLEGVVEFYGVGNDTRESDTNTYWLIAGTQPGLRFGAAARAVSNGGDVDGGVQPQAPTPDAQSPQSFAYTTERKERTIYVPTILNGADENFFGAVISGTASQQTLRVSQLDAASPNRATLSVALQGATTGAHQVSVLLNGNQVGVVSFANTERKVSRFDVVQSALQEGDNVITLRSLNGSSDISLTDYLRLTYAHRYAADDNRLLFATGNRRGATIGGFTTDRVRVFDLTEPNRAFEVAATVRANGAGYDVTVAGNLDNRQMLAIADTQALSPLAITANEPSAWTNSSHALDFIILAPQSLRAAAQPLAALRNTQGLRTAVVTLEDIYDEWSGGAKDTAALHSFLNYARQNWSAGPQYVLFVGDASYDPRNYLGFGATDLMPTDYVNTPDFETASDEALVDFNQDGIGEISIGRLPARTAAQAAAMVNRTVNYVPFNGGATLVADRPDGYDFTGLNQTVRTMLPSTMAVTSINRQGLTDEATRSQINTALNAGPSLLQYAGHGSLETWTGAPLFNVTDALNATNGNHRLPFFVTMTCLNGYLQEPNGTSLAEALLQAPNGGAIAVWASSSLTLPIGQAPMDQSLFQLLYNNGASPRLGDAVRGAKAGTGDQQVRQTWILFGDPTLRIR